MTIEEQIAELLAKAAPLRLLPDDEAEEKGLPGIVEQINALRAKQSRAPVVVAGEEPEFEPDGSMQAAALVFAEDADGLRELQQRNIERLMAADPAESEPRKRGRPRKAE